MPGQPIAVLLVAGAVAGLHSSSWGAFKDVAYERFCARKFARSIVFAVVAAGILYYVLPSIRSLHPVVTFASLMVIERAATEFYKAFLRREDQSKYLIASEFRV